LVSLFVDVDEESLFDSLFVSLLLSLFDDDDGFDA
jgi:hypothetical protein